MTRIRSLEPEKLLRRCDPATLGFETTGQPHRPRRRGARLDDYAKLPEEERSRSVKLVAELEEKLQKLISQVARWRKERRERIRTLNR